MLLIVTSVSTLLIRKDLYRQLELPLRRNLLPTSDSPLFAVLARSGDVCRFASIDGTSAFAISGGDGIGRPGCPDQVELKVDFDNFADLAVGSSSKPFSTDDAKGRPFRASVTRANDDILVAVGVALSGTQNAKRALVLIQLAAIALTLTALWLFGNWFARHGVRSLQRIGTTANAIVAGDRLQRVVTEPGDPEEVRNVATALNEMLDDTDNAFEARNRSERRLRQFVSDASHELRTPLTSIQGYGELLETGVVSTQEQMVDISRRVRSEANRMARLVDDMLRLAHLDAEPRLDVADHDIAEIARAAAADALAADSRWPVSIEATGPATATVDRDAVHQIIANLLTNVRQHTPEGTAAVVSVRTVNDAVEVRVADRGPGIPAAVLSTVFERFVRADASRSRATGGAGLGLSIAKALVTAHGGTITVANLDPNGAVFTVSFPVARVELSSSTPAR